MSDTLHTDGGTVLQSTEAALTMDRDGTVHLYLPDGDEIPASMAALTAMFIRWQRDREWRDDLLQWFKEHAPS